MSNNVVSLILAAIILFAAFPKKAAGKSSGGAGVLANFWSWLWSKAIPWIWKTLIVGFLWAYIIKPILTAPYDFAFWVAGFFTKEKEIKQLTGWILAILTYLCLGYFLRENTAWFSKIFFWLFPQLGEWLKTLWAWFNQLMNWFAGLLP